MLLKHYFTDQIAHSSYILAGQETCAVIDPQRDVEIYIEEARRLGVKITHILETHLHADFISGHLDLAEKTGATIYIGKSADCEYDHIGLSEGDTVELETMRLDVLETPGHTPEHITYVVTDTARGEEPIGAFVGDTLFVGDVGRPDLFPGRARELAEKLYHSLHEKLLKLPDYCEVYPAHGAGSLCGRSMGAKYLTTIGYERAFNPVLQIDNLKDFTKSLTEDMPPAPDHFSRCTEINREGPALVADLPPLKMLTVADFKEKMDADAVQIVDSRSYLSYGSQHLENAWHIDLNGNFPTFAGWVLPPEKQFLLVAEGHEAAEESTLKARRVGIDSVIGYLDGGMLSWVVEGLSTRSTKQISAEELHELIHAISQFVLLDVRSEQEFAEGNIEGAVNIPVADLRTRYAELDKDMLTIVTCGSGKRSSLATSILEQNGFEKVYNLAGGMQGYSAAGYVKECRICFNPHGSRFYSEIHMVNR